MVHSYHMYLCDQVTLQNTIVRIDTEEDNDQSPLRYLFWKQIVMCFVSKINTIFQIWVEGDDVFIRTNTLWNIKYTSLVGFDQDIDSLQQLLQINKIHNSTYYNGSPSLDSSDNSSTGNPSCHKELTYSPKKQLEMISRIEQDEELPYVFVFGKVNMVNQHSKYSQNSLVEQILPYANSITLKFDWETPSKLNQTIGILEWIPKGMNVILNLSGKNFILKALRIFYFLKRARITEISLSIKYVGVPKAVKKLWLIIRKLYATGLNKISTQWKSKCHTFKFLTQQRLDGIAEAVVNEDESKFESLYHAFDYAEIYDDNLNSISSM